MKRYLVFGCDEFDRDGGWQDFKKAFDSLEEATAFCIKTTYTDNNLFYTHIVDIEQMKIIKEFIGMYKDGI